MIRLAILGLVLCAPAAHGDEELVTFGAVGDVMMGSLFPVPELAPDDGVGMLSEVTPVLSAVDVAFGNLEGPLVDEGVSTKCAPPKPARGKHRKRKKAKPKSCYAFQVPTRYGRYLRDAGFDVMSLANNHAMDFGADGRASSVRTLDALGIAHSGAPGDAAHLTVRGRKLALIAFATYTHSHNLNHLDEAVALVSAEAAANDIVVVSFHGGAEGASKTHVPAGAEMFYGENRGDLRVFTHAVIDAGADLVIGHGPHVVRGLEIYKDRLIAYSLGNFATYGGMNLVGLPGIAGILVVWLAGDGAYRGARIHPTVQVSPGGPHLDPANQVVPILQQLSADDFGDARPNIRDDGGICPPPLSPTTND